MRRNEMWLWVVELLAAASHVSMWFGVEGKGHDLVPIVLWPLAKGCHSLRASCKKKTHKNYIKWQKAVNIYCHKSLITVLQ